MISRKKDLMAGILKVKQFIADSTRAWYYYNLTKDSVYIDRFLQRNRAEPKKDTVKAKPASPKPKPPKPSQKPVQDSQRLGILQRDELWNERLQIKKRRDLI